MAIDQLDQVEQEFLFEDYFSDESDPGVQVVVPFKGRPVPFTIKRSLSLKERQAANNAAMKISLDKSGQPKLDGGVDQAAFTNQIILVGLKKWPFKRDGRRLPITLENIERMDGDLANEVGARILGIVNTQQNLDPSERISEGA